MSNHKSLSLQTRLTMFACALALVVVALGAFTRLVDAGLGCPDWPGCYGQLLWPQSSVEIESAQRLFPDSPVDTQKTWPEMVHRYFAGSLGLVIVALAVMALRRHGVAVKTPHNRPVNDARKLSCFLVLLVVVQAAFGMWTVTLKLWPQVVTAHLLGGFATLSLVWLLLLRLWYRDRGGAEESLSLSKRLSCASLTRLRSLAAVTLLAVVMQVALGGWTSSNYAALACIDFPTCHNQWLPATDFAQGFDLSQQIGPNYLGGLMDNEARTAIHLSHRLGALVVTLLGLTLISLLWNSRSALLKRMAVVLGAVLCGQIVLGITNILAALPLMVAVAHNIGGAVLLLTLVTINYHLQREALAYRSRAEQPHLPTSGERQWTMKRS